MFVRPKCMDRKGIEVLPFLEGVRRRPALYIGSVDSDAVASLVRECLLASLSDAAASGVQTVEVSWTTDWQFTIHDDGAVSSPMLTDLPGRMASALTGLSGSSPRGHPDGDFATRQGMGLGVVAALCVRLEVSLCDGTESCTVSARKGMVQAGGRSGGRQLRPGLTIRFRPDFSIIARPGAEFARELPHLLQPVALLVPGVRLRFQDRGSGHRVEAWYPDGALDVLLDRPRRVHQRRVACRLQGRGDSVCFDIAIAKAPGTSIHSIVNGAPTRGGIHHKAVAEGLDRIRRNRRVSKFLFEMNCLPPGWDELGSEAVIILAVANPFFEGSNCDILLGPESIRELIASSVSEELPRLLIDAPDWDLFCYNHVAQLSLAFSGPSDPLARIRRAMRTFTRTTTRCITTGPFRREVAETPTAGCQLGIHVHFCPDGPRDPKVTRFERFGSEFISLDLRVTGQPDSETAAVDLVAKTLDHAVRIVMDGLPDGCEPEPGFLSQYQECLRRFKRTRILPLPW